MTNRRRLFATACGGMFVVGIVLSLLGVLFGLPVMRERLGVNLVQQGDVLLILFFGFLLSTLIAGPMTDSFGNKIVLSASALFVTTALILFSFAASFIAALAAALLLGFGGGGLNTAANALVADLYTNERGSMLNIVGTFYGVGALVMPLSAALIREMFTIPQLLIGAAGLSALLCAWYLATTFPPPKEAVGFSSLASVKAATYPGVMLFGLLLLCQSGNEASIGGWASTYAGTLGASPRAATFILTGYWAALMTGRVAASRLLTRITKTQLVLASGIGSAIGCSTMLVAHSIPIAALGAIITGFSFAAVYPTTLAIAADRYQRLAGTIFGFLFAVGLVGGMLFPWTLGHVSQRAGVRSGMIVPVAGSIAIIAIAFVIQRKEYARANSSSI